MANKKAAGANGGADLDRATAGKFALDLYNTTKTSSSQDFVQLSSLLDLALVEFEQASTEARKHEGLAALYRRRAFKAMDTLRRLQRQIPLGGQAR